MRFLKVDQPIIETPQDFGGDCKLATTAARPIHAQNIVMINEAPNKPSRRQPSGDEKPRRFFVSRHQGAIDWARKHPWSMRVEFVPHLDPAIIGAGDIVIGTLPVHLAARICARGARYLHLAIELSAEQRGQELTAEVLEAAGAHLVPYTVAIDLIDR